MYIQTYINKYPRFSIVLLLIVSCSLRSLTNYSNSFVPSSCLLKHYFGVHTCMPVCVYVSPIHTPNFCIVSIATALPKLSVNVLCCVVDQSQSSFHLSIFLVIISPSLHIYNYLNGYVKQCH